jgi:hypothetical protein
MYRDPDRHWPVRFAVLLAAPLVGACAASFNPAAQDSRLETVVAQTLPIPVVAAADCLADKARRISYPRGYDPFVMARLPAGAGLVVEQWFDLGRHGHWLTRYELTPTAAGQTDVRVRLETELILARSYARAAQELVAYCAGR